MSSNDDVLRPCALLVLIYIVLYFTLLLSSAQLIACAPNECAMLVSFDNPVNCCKYGYSF